MEQFNYCGRRRSRVLHHHVHGLFQDLIKEKYGKYEDSDATVKVCCLQQYGTGSMSKSTFYCAVTPCSSLSKCFQPLYTRKTNLSSWLLPYV